MEYKIEYKITHKTPHKITHKTHQVTHQDNTPDGKEVVIFEAKAMSITLIAFIVVFSFLIP